MNKDQEIAKLKKIRLSLSVIVIFLTLTQGFTAYVNHQTISNYRERAPQNKDTGYKNAQADIGECILGLQTDTAQAMKVAAGNCALNTK